MTWTGLLALLAIYIVGFGLLEWWKSRDNDDREETPSRQPEEKERSAFRSLAPIWLLIIAIYVSIAGIIYFGTGGEDVAGFSIGVVKYLFFFGCIVAVGLGLTLVAVSIKGGFERRQLERYRRKREKESQTALSMPTPTTSLPTYEVPPQPADVSDVTVNPRPQRRRRARTTGTGHPMESGHAQGVDAHELLRRLRLQGEEQNRPNGGEEERP